MAWKITKEGFLTAEFEFNTFVEAIDFVNRIIPIAEQANHHPDILIHSYKKVRVMLKTHSENTVTEKDYEVAEEIDELIV